LSCISPSDSHWAREIYEADWSPCYGSWQGASVVELRAETELPCERAFVLASGASQTPRLLECLADGRGEGFSLYRYAGGDAVVTLAFHDKPGEWSSGAVRSDARLLAWEQRGANRRLLVAGASFLDVGKADIFRDATPLERFE